MKFLRRIAALSAALMLGLGLFAVAAEAYPNAPSGSVSSHGGPGDPGDPGAKASIADPGTSESLPFTGGDVLGLVAIGAVLAGAGFVVVYASRRRHALS
ncbi:MAG: hypothetical protein U0U69_12150 [Acidimicrobiia bacterium]